MNLPRYVLAGALCAALAGCAQLVPRACRSGEQAAVAEMLYFGTATPDGTVSAEQWNGFLEQAVTPRFPQGLTTWEAAGRWRSAAGKIERETSHVLYIVYPNGAANDRAVRDIIGEYKAKFRQEAVLRVRSEGCVSF